MRLQRSPVGFARRGGVEDARAPGLPPEARELLRFAVGPHAVGDIADRLITWLAMEPEQQDAVRASLVATARRLFGWEGVAAGVIAAAQGLHDALMPAP